MITTEQKQKALTALKNHTLTSVRKNQKNKLPIIISTEITIATTINKDGILLVYENGDIEAPNIKVIENEVLDIIPENLEEVVMLNNTLTEHVITNYRVINQRSFHYDDKWYSYKFSVDEPQYTFGILKVDNMPYLTFERKRNKKSFVCSIHDLIYQGYCEPFMVFINGEFVDWNCIDLVFDCDDTYLLLYGEKYNWYNLCNAKLHVVVLPFKVEYIGNESDEHFDMMYDITKSYIQDSLTVDENNKIHITIPGMDEMYEYRGMIYNVGAWLYTQLKYEHLGLLSKDRTAKLKKFDINKYEYNEFGNISNTIVTKFNALDKDSYDKKIYDRICLTTIDTYESNALFRFNDDGLLTDDGNNIIALLDEDMEVYKYNYSDRYIGHIEDHIDNTLFADNYMIFRDGRFFPDCDVQTSIFNTIRIDNPYELRHDIYILYHNPTEKVVIHSNHFNSRFAAKALQCIQSVKLLKDDNTINTDDEYIEEAKVINNMYLDRNNDFSSKLKKYIEDVDQTTLDRKNYLNMCLKCLDYDYYNSLLYDQNIDNSIDEIIKYDPMLLNDLYKTNIESTVMPGSEVNNYITEPFQYESHRGLKIPRNKYKNHESYALIFEDGELIEEYCNMVAYANFLFIPMDRLFDPNSQIELLYFNNINNNEIEFDVTQFMVDNMPTKDFKWRKTTIFNQFIKQEELKVFCHFPEDILKYKGIVTESEDIAFNISYRDDNNDLYLIKSVVDKSLSDHSRNNKFTAVSSRKFIYQRLYVDQKAYRIAIDKRFRYCDNQKQYVLFVNGRRMNDESFLITIPKHTRPFWAMYLYVARYVGPEDRIELFYLPDELVDINMNHDSELLESGYISTDKTTIDVPYDPRLYLLFINGKKIPSTNIIAVDSHTFRINKDTLTTNNLMINPIYTDCIPKIKESLNNSTSWSSYDNIIRNIKGIKELGYSELDSLLNIFVKMSNTELDKSKQNVGRIAIINEIVRDFWVTSGYAYNELPFIYDYQMDDYIPIDRNNNAIIPALDATKILNIIKNEVHLLYFEHTPEEKWYEIGSYINSIKFSWEYSKNLYTELKLYSQIMKYKSMDSEDYTTVNLDINSREWNLSNKISKDFEFNFTASTGYQLIERDVKIRFANGIYYGNIDEDLLQHYGIEENDSNILNGIMGLSPKNGIIPSYDVQQAESGEYTASTYKNNNIVYTKIKYEEISTDPDYASILSASSLNETESVININVSNSYNSNTYTTSSLSEYTKPSDLQHMMGNLNKEISESPELYLNTYIIGNNNYFVYACPKRLVYDGNELLIEFILPDPHSEDVIANCRDDKATPIYTSGNWNINDHNLLEPLEYMEMLYLGEFLYKNPSGYSETYCAWRTNGFFTRLFENYKFTIKIRYKDGAHYVDDVESSIIN